MSFYLSGKTWSLQEADTLLFLDLDWTLQAIPDLLIEQHSYGGLFIRMPFRQSSGATVLNDGGKRDDDTEQQPAAWVDLHMPLENSEKRRWNNGLRPPRESQPPRTLARRLSARNQPGTLHSGAPLNCLPGQQYAIAIV